MKAITSFMSVYEHVSLNCVIIHSVNGLTPVQLESIFWTNDDLLSKYFSKIYIKMIKNGCAKWRSFVLNLLLIFAIYVFQLIMTVVIYLWL